jgi:hypothetical protein
MLHRSTLHRVWMFALMVAITMSGFAAKKVRVEPGQYEGWGPDIDKIEIVKTFSLSSYSKLVVAPLDVSSVSERGDADLADKVDAVLAGATKPFLEGLRKKMTKLETREGESSQADGTLIVRAKVTVMDPGSRSKRMWVGYGAGAARTAIEGEVVDAKTGAVLARFTQERRSGIERFGRGSSYEEILERNVAAIGRDVANLLNEF